MDLELTDTPLDNTAPVLLQHSVAQLQEIVYCVDQNGALIYINHYGHQKTGIQFNELPRISIFDVNPSLTTDRWRMAKKAALDNKQWKITNQQMLCHAKHVLVEISISHFEFKNISYYYCLARPISKLSQSEKLLDLIAQATASYSGEMFFKTLMKYMAQVLHVRIAFITQCLEQPPTRVRMLAFWSADRFMDNLEYDLVGTPCDTVINGKTDFLVKSNLGKIYPKENGFAESYYGIPIYDHKNSLVLGHIAFLDDYLMSSSGLDYTVFEILASRASVELLKMQTESALEVSEDKYRLLVENQTDLIMRLDADSTLNFASPSCLNKLGKSQAQLLGSKFHQYIHRSEVDIVNNVWRLALKPPYLQHFEVRTRTAQGWCWFAWSLRGVINENDLLTEIIAVGRDVSQRKLAENQMHDTLKQLAHVSRLSSMGEMATGIAHEINQPLTAILSFAQASLRMYDQENPDTNEQRIALERIAVNAKLAGDIVKRIRAFTRKADPSKTAVNLPLLIEEVIELTGNELRNNDVSISVQINDNLPLVLADAIQIQQVLLNLIRNGIEAIIENMLNVREILLNANMCESSDFVSIQILDSGPGIPKPIQDQLFTAFFTTKTDGLGIGLSICHTIIEAHNGNLTVTTPPNNSTFNTAFQFTLPIFKEQFND